MLCTLHHESDETLCQQHSEGYKMQSNQRFCQTFVIAGQSPEAGHPGEVPCNAAAARLEIAVQPTAPKILDTPGTTEGHQPCHWQDQGRDQGDKIDENQTIGFYVPEFRGSAWENIRVREVMDMTPGLDTEVGCGFRRW